MKKNEKFLELYREYEGLLRDKGIDCKDYENQAEPGLSKRLYICRQTRNYLSHTSDPGFVEVSDAQISFLQALVNELKFADDVLKKHLKTPRTSVCDEKDKVIDAINKMVKLRQDILVVKTKTGFGTIDMYSATSAFLKSKATRLDKLKLGKQFKCYPPLTKIEDLPRTLIVCTDNGEVDGKLLGTYKGV